MKKLIAFTAAALISGFAIAYANEVVVVAPTKAVDKGAPAQLGNANAEMSAAF